MPPSIRAFIAAVLPPDLRDAIHASLTPHRLSHPGLRWVAAANLHLTVKFLGNVEVTSVDELVRAAGRACSLHAPFEISLSGWGAFPPRGAPRTLWLGVERGQAELRRLARDVDRNLAKRGVPAETRPFSAHLTVARWPRDAGPGREPGALPASLPAAVPASVPAGLPAADWGPFGVSRLSFMRSDLRPGGPVYEELARMPLGVLP